MTDPEKKGKGNSGGHANGGPANGDHANGHSGDSGRGHSSGEDDLHRRIQRSDRANLTADPAALSPWERVKLARHPDRPYTLDYIGYIFTDFTEIHGDRRFADDPAIVAGFASFQGEPCVVIGHQKGRTTKQRKFRNFGMAKPEGYRKALRVMKLADKFSRPIFTFVDTQAAYPGIDAEERGQAEAIAYNLREIFRLQVPIVVAVTGEGGSGGALGIAVGDIVLMLENSIYSVIPPEACSAILWRDQNHAEQAARALKLTAPDLIEFGLIDQIVPEPEGGAHTNHTEAASIVAAYLADALASVRALSGTDRLERRYQRLRAIGEFDETTAAGRP
ncbi:MAG TPA: acetyl-CoA carboxylase carboxyltransferase subunit alpha [Blastocatellia bacterium]